ncbi:hypothetical protein EKH77_02805 [Streptomyces luteoverticillatus]|uniref:Holin n=1 Tax=Streptomyces luteoverticillatus TaxID=66425 RepID=A0A3Q9FWH3_STRLT|nr:hypothetical protein [Streptomyces luteoverticillatus]AZQ70286.1 hypothetical protein EKH77_02805 [Streptomyces luteoverticillatus]
MTLRNDIRDNPVMVRAIVVAALSLLGAWVPALAGIEHTEPLVGAVVAAVTLFLGHSARARVTPNHRAVLREEAEAILAQVASPTEQPTALLPAVSKKTEGRGRLD